jgi:hypothetical protein
LFRNQIKSATDNNGNFDEANDDIRFQSIGEKEAQNYLDNSEGKENKKEKNVLPLQNIIIKKGEVDYVRLQELSSRVIRGDATIARLNREEERGRSAGGRTNVEATLYLGAKISHDRQKYPGSRNILSAKEKL